jgi:hypothetical protein
VRKIFRNKRHVPASRVATGVAVAAGTGIGAFVYKHRAGTHGRVTLHYADSGGTGAAVDAEAAEPILACARDALRAVYEI